MEDSSPVLVSPPFMGSVKHWLKNLRAEQSSGIHVLLRAQDLSFLKESVSNPIYK